MDTTSPKPRINGSMLSSMIGQHVCLVGKNMGIAQDGLSINVETSDGQKIGARFPRPFHDPLDPYIELLGKVETDCSLSVQRVVNFGVDFDLDAYDEIVRLSSSFPNLFMSSGVKADNNMDF